MPTYGYRCGTCAHEFERVQKMTDAPLTECESCGGAVKKILYPVGISFKGPGFYVTDYKGGGEKKAEGAKADGGAKSEGGGDAAKSEAKSDAKTETKSETKTETAKPAASGAS